MNRLSTLTLDLKIQLPKLSVADLSQNLLKNLTIINSDTGHHMKSLNLLGNLFDGPYVWKWATDNRKETKTNLLYNYPLCDCRIFPAINEFNTQFAFSSFENLVGYCRAPLQKFILVTIDKISCKVNGCNLYEGYLEKLSAYDRPYPNSWIYTCSGVNNTTKIQEILNKGLLNKDMSDFPRVPGDFFIVLENSPTLRALPILSNIIIENKKTYINAENAKIKTVDLENLPNRELIE